MRQILVLLIFFLPLKGFTQNHVFFYRPDTKINNLLILQPVTIIAGIDKNSRQRLDSALTKETFRNTSMLLKKILPDSVSSNFFTADSAAAKRIANFAMKLNKKVKNARQVNNFILPDSVLNLFDTAKIDFVFCTFNGGFTRTKTNVVNTQLTMEVLDVLIGFGMRPLESTAMVNCFVMDLKQKNIFFFERDIWQDNDPTDVKTIRLMLTRAVMHCFL